MANEPDPRDPFRDARRSAGVLQCPFQGAAIPMILRHADVREAAKDWQTFSSDAPFRVPIPSEEALGTMRQLPIETNPPEHTEYRAIAAPHARLIVRSLLQALVERVERIHLLEVKGHKEVEPLSQRSNGYDSLTVRLTARRV